MATLCTQRAIIVVIAAAQSAANARAKQVDAVGGERTFVNGLSPTGTAPATHYWCGWWMQPAEYASLSAKLNSMPQAGSRVWIYDGNTTSEEVVLTTMGLQRINAP